MRLGHEVPFRFLICGIPRSAMWVELYVAARSRAASFLPAASRLTWSPSASPSQPFDWLVRVRFPRDAGRGDSRSPPRRAQPVTPGRRPAPNDQGRDPRRAQAAGLIPDVLTDAEPRDKAEVYQSNSS